MNSRSLSSLENLLSRNKAAGDPEIKVALGRLRAEINERVKTGNPGSLDFLCSSARVLSRVRGIANASVRLECLSDIGLFLLLQGYSALALPAVTALETLSQRTHSRLWARRAAMYAGVLNGDLGNVAQAVI